MWKVTPVIFKEGRNMKAEVITVESEYRYDARRVAEKMMKAGAWGEEIGPFDEKVETLYSPRFIDKVFIWEATE
jgi:hypothetical protein